MVSVVELNVNDLRVLSFGKYLLQQAQSQAKLSHPLNSAAVMSAQDAIELFLTVLANKYEINADKVRFMEYWECLAKKGVQLQYKEEMRHLNSCRVSIKHSGAFASTEDIDRALNFADLFIRDVVERVFSTSFDDLSLIQFIAYEEVRDLLNEAQQALHQNDYVCTLEKAAEAFSALLDNYIDSRKVHPWDNAYRFSQLGAFDTGFNLMKTANGDIPRYIDRVSESINALSKAVKVLALGIDFDSFEHFKMITPEVYSFAGASRTPCWLAETREAVSDNSSCAEWALNFVIETAVALSSRPAPAKLTSFSDDFLQTAG